MPWVVVLALLLVASPAQVRTPAGYDPARDPARDLQEAVTRAPTEGKRILLVVGGEWCGWCHILERYLEADADVRAAWSGAFVVLKVNFSRENENREFLSRYPEIPGYPHFFVLDKDGTFRHSQGTAALESGSSYSKEKMLGFIGKWSARLGSRASRSRPRTTAPRDSGAGTPRSNRISRSGSPATASGRIFKATSRPSLVSRAR
jgi:hypothetical protein